MKKKKNRIIKIIISIAILFTIVGIYLYKSGFFLEPLKRLNYSDTTITYLKENDLDETIKTRNIYSKTLDQAIISNKFILNNLDYYLSLEYIENDNFIDNINSLVTVGYSFNEIESIFKNYNNNQIDIILNFSYNENVNKIFNLSYYHEENKDRYLNYLFLNLDLSVEDIVTYINIGLDKEVWKNPNIITEQNNDLILVNKYNMINKDYEPENMEIVNSKWTKSESKLVKPAKEAFEKMASAMEDVGFGIKITTSYRTYSYQNSLWTSAIKNNGQTYANNYVAKPGYSEHHTGYAADLISTNTDGGSNSSNRKLFKDTKEYAWLIKNAHNYGFILRYPSGKEKITGYNYESWHFRYVGIEIATYIYENNLTLEEYLARK